MSRIARLVLSSLVVLSVAFAAAPAFAAEPTWQRIDVALHAEPQRPLMLVAGLLAEDVKLPAEVELAVPAGMQIEWIGEVLGGPTSEDPELQYTKTSAEGMDVYRFTLTEGRAAQIEGLIPNPENFDGTAYTTALAWTPWEPVPEVRIGQQLPAGAAIAEAAPDAVMQPSGTDSVYYVRTLQNPPVGEPIELAFSYTAPAAGTAPGGSAAAVTPPSQQSSNTALFIIIAVTVAAFAFVIYKIRGKMATDGDEAPGSPATSVEAGSPAPSDSRIDAAAPMSADVPEKRTIKPAVPALIVVAVLLAGALFAINAGSSASTTGGVITKSFGASDP